MHIGSLFRNYEAALGVLAKDLEAGELSRLEMGGVCKQFELVVKLGWNLWKEYLVYKDIAPKFKNPRLTIAECRANGVFEEAGIDGAVFAQMFEDRIHLSDLYNFDEFAHIATSLKRYYLKELITTQTFFTEFLNGNDYGRLIKKMVEEHNMDSIKMIHRLSGAFGAPGFEDDVIEAAKEFVPDSYTCERDSLLNLYITSKQRKEDAKTVLVEAHSDELGLMVQYVRPNGTLSVVALGSWAHCALPSQRMRIKNLDGKIVSGIVAAKPPHLTSGTGAVPEISELSVDVGATSALEVEREYRIGVGCPMVPDAVFEYRQENDLIIGKAFDCRLGCAAVLDVLNNAGDTKINLVGALCSQEEVGARGARVVAERVRPDVVICFEGSPADDTFAEAPVVALKKGPMIRHMDSGAITNPRLMRLTLDVARKAGIQCQEAVRASSFTNAAAYQTLGIPAVVIACPVRYIHSHNAIAAASDYDKAVKLAVEVIQSLDDKTISSL